jgi:hypothetical protein
MKLTLGLAAGFAAGYWFGHTPAEVRRAKVDEAWRGVRDNPRLHRVADTVAQDARKVSDAVEQRIVDTANGTADAVAGTVEPGKQGAGRPNTGTARSKTS